MARECVCYLCNTKGFFLWKCTRVQYIERIGSTPPFFDRQIAAPIYRIYSKPTQYTLEHELNSEQLSEKRQIAVIELDVTLICFCDIYLNWTLCVVYACVWVSTLTQTPSRVSNSFQCTNLFAPFAVKTKPNNAIKRVCEAEVGYTRIL